MQFHTLPRHLARRTTLAAATAVAIAASLLGTALPAQAAAPKSTVDPRDSATTETIPAPPKPGRAKPVERVVASTTTTTTTKAASTLAVTAEAVAAAAPSGTGAPGAG